MQDSETPPEPVTLVDQPTNVATDATLPELTRVLEALRARYGARPPAVDDIDLDGLSTSLSQAALSGIIDRLTWDDWPVPPQATGEHRPALSIVVPVYGTEAFIDDCVRSLREQSLADVEIILVDDQSPDRTNDVILQHLLEDRRIRLVRNAENRGLLRARQSGVAFARGRYLAHVDSDDYVTPEVYQQALALADETGSDIVQFAMAMLKDGEIVSHDLSQPKYKRLENRQIFAALLNKDINFSVCNKLYRRELWNSVKHRFPRTSLMVEDLSQNLHLMHAARHYASVPDVGYIYRITAESDSRGTSIQSVAKRGYAVARHIAKLKAVLKSAGELDRYLPLIASFEKSAYQDYVRRVVNRHNNAEGEERDIAYKWLRRIYRVNGFLPLRNHTSFDSALVQKLIHSVDRPMEARPTASIVVPVYNIADYLDQCLASIAAQSLKDIEVLVVNDCSTDRSPEIIDAWCARDNRFRRIDHSRNRGLLQARLSGVKVARGAYIGHVDGDDWIDPAMFEVLATMARTKNADIVQCGYAEHHASGVRTVLGRAIPDRVFSDIFRDFLLLRGISNSMWNKLYKRELWVAAMPYMPPITYKAEDLTQNTILMAMAARYSHVGEPFYQYRIREGSGDRSQSAQNIGARAVSACYNMQRVRYVGASLKFSHLVEEGIAARENSYFKKTFEALRAYSHKNPYFSTDVLRDCLKYCDMRYARFIGRVMAGKAAETASSNKSNSGNSTISQPTSPPRLPLIERGIVRVLASRDGYSYYATDRGRYIHGHRLRLVRLYGKYLKL